MLYHYVYRIDRPSKGEWYIGIRQCKKAPLEDIGYMGSGDRVKRVKRSELVKTILVQVESWDEAARLERLLVGPEQLKDPKCLNIAIGGGTAPMLGRKHTGEAKAKMSAASKGMEHTDEAKAKIGEASKGNQYAKGNTSRRGIQLTAETKAKLSAANLGKKHTDETKAKMSAASKGNQRAKGNTSRRGIKHTDETKAKMSAAKQGKKLAPWTAERRAKVAATWAAKKKNG
tara:strand:+ start:249 stop:938 length:690 start_codon:yes stop_codon:yes gene_type:complete